MTDFRSEDFESYFEAMADAFFDYRNNERLKNARADFTDQLWDHIETNIFHRLSENFRSIVSQLADNAVEAMLKGQPDQVNRYLRLDGYTGRHADQSEFVRKRSVAEMHTIIHGKLHEGSAMALRREIVEANADLLKDERVKDLEDQLASLIAQLNDRDKSIADLNAKLCELYTPTSL